MSRTKENWEAWSSIMLFCFIKCSLCLCGNKCDLSVTDDKRQQTSLVSITWLLTPTGERSSVCSWSEIKSFYWLIWNYFLPSVFRASHETKSGFLFNLNIFLQGFKSFQLCIRMFQGVTILTKEEDSMEYFIRISKKCHPSNCSLLGTIWCQVIYDY